MTGAENAEWRQVFVIAEGEIITFSLLYMKKKNVCDVLITRAAGYAVLQTPKKKSMLYKYCAFF